MNYYASRFGPIAREWTPVDLETAAASYVRYRAMGVQPSTLLVARQFQEWCADHPEHGYDPEDGYYAALAAGGFLRLLVVPSDELDDIPERWMP